MELEKYIERYAISFHSRIINMQKNILISGLFVIAILCGILSSLVQNTKTADYLMSASTVLIIYVLLNLEWSMKIKLFFILLFFITFITLALLSYFH